RDLDAGAGLRLPQPDGQAVIGRPGQAQEIALPLAGPQGEQQRQMQVSRSVFEERRLVLDAPHKINARPMINSSTSLAGVDCDLAAILRPREYPRQNSPRIIGLSL